MREREGREGTVDKERERAREGKTRCVREIERAERERAWRKGGRAQINYQSCLIAVKLEVEEGYGQYSNITARFK